MQSFAKLATSSLVLILSFVSVRVTSVDEAMLFAQGVSPDIDPAKVDSKWWDVNGGDEAFPGAYVDGNGVPHFTQNYVRTYVAATQLINTHVRTSAGNNIMHAHHDRDMDAIETVEANRWFDFMFGAQDTPPKTARQADATVKTNCHAYALGTLGKGTYGYWIQGTDVSVAIKDDCTATKKSAVKDGDLLVYGSPFDHTSVIYKASWWYGTSTKLRWKMHCSGVYEQVVDGSLDTPRYDMTPFPAVGGGFDPKVWTWGTALAGDDAQLWGDSLPQGQYVWRKKP